VIYIQIINTFCQLHCCCCLYLSFLKVIEKEEEEEIVYISIVSDLNNNVDLHE
jgi:hypothetical protein